MKKEIHFIVADKPTIQALDIERRLDDTDALSAILQMKKIFSHHGVLEMVISCMLVRNSKSFLTVGHVITHPLHITAKEMV